MLLRLKVTPNARKDEILGWEEDPQAGRLLRVRLKAPPVDGKANTALVRFLAASLRLPKSKITLRKGCTGRIKTFEIPDDTSLP